MDDACINHEGGDGEPCQSSAGEPAQRGGLKKTKNCKVKEKKNQPVSHQHRVGSQMEFWVENGKEETFGSAGMTVLPGAGEPEQHPQDAGTRT